jgi:glycosyltransferase involved in cell wall biosynthesis
MKVVYTAPNRGHHYKYASAIDAVGYLRAFVSGYPRISPYGKDLSIDGHLCHADIIQTIYVMSLKLKMPSKISRYLAFLSKLEQDRMCRKYMDDCDVFIFYNGSGLNSSRLGRKHGVISIVEAVNSHVEYQEDLLREEHEKRGLIWIPFPENEKNRRLTEYREADYILLPSEFVKRSFISKGFSESKLLKVPYGFNRLNISDTFNIVKSKRDDFTILYVGSISVRKGVRYLIEAFKGLDCSKKRLVIVGPNNNDGALEGVILTDEIVFTGVLKGLQLEETYKSADVFCLPSLEEGLALVLGEALSYGLPIIATCNTGADDIISDGVEGYIVPISDSESILNRLQSLVDNPEALEEMRINAHTKAGKVNGWDETYNLLIQTLNQVCIAK